MQTHVDTHQDSIVLAGHPFAPIGMGEHVRSAFRAFESAGMATRLFDIYGMSERDDPDFEAAFANKLTDRMSRRINIFHINGDEIELALSHRADPNFKDAYNIIYPAWELSKYPEPWARQLERFDEVWAPSEFIKEAVEKSVSTKVVHMPLAVDVHMSSFMTRRALGLPEHGFIYLFFFDYSSYMSRKNPVAVLEAFQRLTARQPNAPLYLVMKHKGGQPEGPDAEVFQSIMKSLRDQIVVIDRTLKDNEVRNLMRAADAFVSLHRSEGFGRGLAEAMALGVPAIGTGYSGNLDFMTPDTSLLVDHGMKALKANEYPFAENQEWAEPDIDHAVDLMEKVWLEPSFAKQVAARARRHLMTNFSPLATGLRYVRRIEAIQADLKKTGTKAVPLEQN